MSLKNYSILKTWLNEDLNRYVTVRPTYLESKEKMFKYGEIDFFNTDISAMPIACTFFKSYLDEPEYNHLDECPNENPSKYLVMSDSVYRLLRENMNNKCDLKRDVLYIGLSHFYIISSPDKELVIDSSFWQMKNV